MRRIVQYPSSTHYSDIKISPQWHQWLRHTRSEPPSLTEQAQDIVRQRNLKRLAAEADARWAAKPSFLDSPGQPERQQLPDLQGKDPRLNSNPDDSDGAGKPARDKTERIVREQGISTGNADVTAQKEEMHLPDGLRDQSNESPGQNTRSHADQRKDKSNPWDKTRGKDKWQPAAWDGNLGSLRR